MCLYEPFRKQSNKALAGRYPSRSRSMFQYWASACFAVLPSYTTFMISVRQVKVLPPASFSFHLKMDTLALGYSLPATGRLRDFHPLEYAPAGRTNSQNARRTVRRAFWYSGEVSHSGMGLPRRRYMVFLTARMIFS